MLSLYPLAASVRIALIVMLYLGMTMQLAGLVLRILVGDDFRWGWRYAFEFGIFLNYLLLTFVVSIIHFSIARNLVQNPLLHLRYLSMLIPLLGVPLVTFEKSNSDAIALIAVTLTLPFMETFFAGDFYLVLMFSTMLLLLVSVSHFVALRNKVNTVITRVSVKNAFDRFPQAIAYGKREGKIFLQNQTMRTLLGRLGIYSQKTKELAAALQEKASADQNNLNALVVGEKTYSLKINSLKVPTKNWQEISLYDITSERALLEEMMVKNRQTQESNDRLKVLMQKVEEIETQKQREKLRYKIHDIIGQRLSILHIYTEKTEKLDATDLERLMPLIDGMLEDLASVPQEDLSPTLENIKNTVALVGTELKVEGTPPSNRTVASALYKILREGANNAIRHGMATVIKAVFQEKKAKDLHISPEEEEVIQEYQPDLLTKLRAHPDLPCVILEITNDGKVPTGNLSEGEGIRGMRQALDRISGVLIIQSQKDFALQILVPLEPDPEKEPILRAEDQTLSTPS